MTAINILLVSLEMPNRTIGTAPFNCRIKTLLAVSEEKRVKSTTYQMIMTDLIKNIFFLGIRILWNSLQSGPRNYHRFL